jgi:hypothetical protein
MKYRRQCKTRKRSSIKTQKPWKTSYWNSGNDKPIDQIKNSAGSLSGVLDQIENRILGLEDKVGELGQSNKDQAKKKNLKKY